MRERHGATKGRLSGVAGSKTTSTTPPTQSLSMCNTSVPPFQSSRNSPGPRLHPMQPSPRASITRSYPNFFFLTAHCNRDCLKLVTKEGMAPSASLRLRGGPLYSACIKTPCSYRSRRWPKSASLVPNLLVMHCKPPPVSSCITCMNLLCGVWWCLPLVVLVGSHPARERTARLQRMSERRRRSDPGDEPATFSRLV